MALHLPQVTPGLRAQGDVNYLQWRISEAVEVAPGQHLLESTVFSAEVHTGDNVYLRTLLLQHFLGGKKQLVKLNGN